LVSAGRLPRSRLFVWKDPQSRRDIIVFLGEAQPPGGKYAFCRRLIDYARHLGIERVFTFAAMATQMHPEAESRVFGAAIDEESLNELKQLEVEIMEEGQISGLNGVLLGVAADVGLRGSCLLGEMPALFAQLPFPKASLAVLQVFTMMAQLELDTSELAEQAQAMERKLVPLYEQVERAMEQQKASAEMADPELEEEDGDESGESESSPSGEASESEKALSPDDEARIERLFEKARQDRSTAYELKRELDRLGVFARYQDRFLDLFKNPGG